MYENARNDLAAIIAQETSGIIGAIPEPEDYALADTFIDTINNRFN